MKQTASSEPHVFFSDGAVFLNRIRGPVEQKLTFREEVDIFAVLPDQLEIMLDDRIIAFAEAVLGPISPTIILNDGEVIDVGPGESAQPLHRDDDAWHFANPGSPMIVNTIAALVDVTPEMGGTLVVPGSHRWEPDRVPNDDEINIYGTDPNDADSDDDGLGDGVEVMALDTDPLDADSDDDNLTDGLESGVATGTADSGGYSGDTDPSTTTDPLNADSDNDGILDGVEDLNTNGAQDSSEWDPNDADSDDDNVGDGEEDKNRNGVYDDGGATAFTNPPASFETDPLDSDSDNDGVLGCNDACSGTPPDTPVDEFGCPLDDETPGGSDTGAAGADDDKASSGGCGCDSATSVAPWLSLLPLLALAGRRRR